MQPPAAFVILIVIICALSTTSAELCKCVDFDEFMGCSCCVKAPLINEGCARADVNFPEFDVRVILESNGKTVFNKTFGPSHSNICLPTPPLSPCIGLTHIYTKEHYVDVCAVLSASIPFIPKYKLRLPCLVIDHGKPTFTKNKYEQ